jgi:quinoprotein glucose dehydrogenase
MPSNNGGPNWPGGAVDPQTGILYIYSFTQVTARGLVHDPQRSDMEYILGTATAPGAGGATGGRSGAGGRAGGAGRAGGGRAGAGRGDTEFGEGGFGRGLTVQGLPLVKPPWGRISAIDLGKGEIVWQVAHGETPDAVRNHPALKGLTIPRTGRSNGRIGTLVTKTLVIAGEPGFFTTPAGVRGAMLRAYDKATGAEVGSVYMPAPQTGSPMTYMLNGQQYLVIATSGATSAGELLAFKLPSESISPR